MQEKRAKRTMKRMRQSIIWANTDILHFIELVEQPPNVLGLQLTTMERSADRGGKGGKGEMESPR